MSSKQKQASKQQQPHKKKHGEHNMKKDTQDWLLASVCMDTCSCTTHTWKTTTETAEKETEKGETLNKAGGNIN